MPPALRDPAGALVAVLPSLARSTAQHSAHSGITLPLHHPACATPPQGAGRRCVYRAPASASHARGTSPCNQ